MTKVIEVEASTSATVDDCSNSSVVFLWCALDKQNKVRLALHQQSDRFSNLIGSGQLAAIKHDGLVI